jgi:hypothetical protein
MKTLTTLTIGALLLILAGPAFAQQSVLVKQFSDQNGSGETGLVTILPNATGDGITVTLALSGEPAGASQPAHIHTGSCGPSLGGVFKPLSPVVDGQSVTNIPGLTIAALASGTYAVNVHKSAAEITTYVSCANLQ